MQYIYFCDTCGFEFKDARSLKDELGVPNDISCPHCGCWDILPKSPEGAAESLANLNEYEAKLLMWDDNSSF